MSRLEQFLGLFTLLLGVTVLALLYFSLMDFSVDSFGHLESSPCACHTCLTEGNPWLKKLIKSSPKPFVSKKHKTSQEAFNWWKHLQGETRDISFFNKTVDSLFEIFPPVPDVAEPSPDRCMSCAVVGNSGNLKGSHYGPLIDFHDVVIRMNQGRTEGYEEDVGMKTTHHVMYPQSAKRLDNNIYLVFFPFHINDLLWLHKKFQPEVKSEDRIANKDLVMILNPAFMKYVHEAWLGKKGKYPSTGFLTVVLSMLMCDELSIFGFGADKDGNWNHYFEILKNKNLRTGPHFGMHEYDIIQQVHEKGKINFFKA